MVGRKINQSVVCKEPESRCCWSRYKVSSTFTTRTKYVTLVLSSFYYIYIDLLSSLLLLFLTISVSQPTAPPLQSTFTSQPAMEVFHTEVRGKTSQKFLAIKNWCPASQFGEHGSLYLPFLYNSSLYYEYFTGTTNFYRFSSILCCNSILVVKFILRVSMGIRLTKFYIPFNQIA